MNPKSIFFMLLVLLAIVVVALPIESKAEEVTSESKFFKDDISDTHYKEAYNLNIKANSTKNEKQALILFNELLNKYNEILKIHPDHPMILFKRGVTYTWLGEYEKGIEDYNKFLMTSPHDSLALENRGRIYELMGDIENSYRDYKTVQLGLNQAKTRTTQPGILSRFDKDLLRINQKLKELEDSLDKEGKSLPEVLPPSDNSKELDNGKEQSSTNNSSNWTYALNGHAFLNAQNQWVSYDASILRSTVSL